MGAFDRNSIFYPVPQKIQHIRPAFNNDNGIRVLDIGAGRDLFIPDRSNLFNAYSLRDIIQKFITVNGSVFKTVEQYFLRTLDDFFPLDDTDILDGFHYNMGYAGPDPIDGLKRR